jgi:hypothetical protein
MLPFSVGEGSVTDPKVVDEWTRRRAVRSTAAQTRRQANTRKRTTRQAPTGSVYGALRRPYAGDARQIDAKTFALATLMAYTPVGQEVKVGAVAFNSSGGRFAESVVSYFTPGDMSRVRSPGRSIAYRAVTPGGGGKLGRAIGGGPSAVRCPVGYQFGGRFSNRQLANCGQQLFDLPGNGINKPNAPAPEARGAVQSLTRTIIGARNPRAKLTRAGRIGVGDYSKLSATITRMAQVPRVGGSSPKRSDASIAEAVRTASSAKTDFTRLVRRDGVALDARVAVAKLTVQRKNPDMQDGTIVRRLTGNGIPGADEVGLFQSGIASIRLVSPNGDVIRLDRTRPLKPAEASELTRQWATLRRASDLGDGTVGLQRLADRSRGKLDYSETFNGDIQMPNETIRVSRNGTTKLVQRWYFEAFLSEQAPGRSSDAAPWKEIGVLAQGDNAKIERSTLSRADALKRFDENGNIEEIPPAHLADVLARSKDVKRQALGNNRTLFTRKNGDQYVQTQFSSGQSAFAEKIAADLERAFGVPTPVTRVAGTGRGRSLVAATPENAVPEGKLDFASGLRSVRVEDLARIALTDFILGRRDRSPGTIGVVRKGDRLLGVPAGNGRVLLAGDVRAPGKPSLAAALVRKPEEILASSDGSGWLRPLAANRPASAQVMEKMYQTLLDEASGFDWSAYYARLGVDGELSAADKLHLEIIQRLVKGRIEQLRSSQKSVLRVLGAGTV